MIQGMIGDTRRVDSECSQLVASGHGRALILELSDRFPCVKPRVGNGHERVLGGSAQEAKTTHAHRGYLAASPCLFSSTHSTKTCRISPRGRAQRRIRRCSTASTARGRVARRRCIVPGAPDAHVAPRRDGLSCTWELPEYPRSLTEGAVQRQQRAGSHAGLQELVRRLHHVPAPRRRQVRRPTSTTCASSVRWVIASYCRAW